MQPAARCKNSGSWYRARGESCARAAGSKTRVVRTLNRERQRPVRPDREDQGGLRGRRRLRACPTAGDQHLHEIANAAGAEGTGSKTQRVGLRGRRSGRRGLTAPSSHTTGRTCRIRRFLRMIQRRETPRLVSVRCREEAKPPRARQVGSASPLRRGARHPLRGSAVAGLNLSSNLSVCSLHS